MFHNAIVTETMLAFSANTYYITALGVALLTPRKEHKYLTLSTQLFYALTVKLIDFLFLTREQFGFVIESAFLGAQRTK